MAFVLNHLRDLADSSFDEIIDVRSPGELQDDHVPGAINLPVLSDEERALVGTIYKQESAFRARKIGGALVAKRAGMNIEQHLLDKPGSYRPLVYCWRGGMRSGAFATILKQIGWRAEVLEGGYKSYRRAVVELLYSPGGRAEALARRLIVVDGNTGTAKTELLHKMAARGAQVIDLEGLAGHRGSLFGGMDARQSSQKTFDSAIARHLAGFDPARPVFVEAESSRIGRLALPNVLWSLMREAPKICVEAPLAERGAYLTRAYANITSDRERLSSTLDLLKPYHAADRLKAWQALAAEGRMEDLACELAAHHYDPKYDRQRARDPRREVGSVHLESFAPDALDRAALEILSLADNDVTTLS